MSKQKELQDWGVPLLEHILPLPENDLRQIITYATTSPDLKTPDAIAAHFTDLLGSEPAVIEFIAEFNARVFPSHPTSSKQRDDSSAPPRRMNKGKQKAPLGKLPALRKPNEGYGSTGSGDDMFEKKQNLYVKKKDEGDYMTLANPRKSATATTPVITPTGSRSSTPAPGPKAQSKQGGTLTSDLLNVKTKKAKAPAVAVHLTGGSSMRAPSEDMSDLSFALRSLEMTTNPSLPSQATDEKSLKSRFCGCNALKHDLLLAAPNCLSCGKIICIKEGLGPCTFCGSSLIPAEDLDAMKVFLANERGKEKMEAHNANHKKVEVARSGGTAYGLQKTTVGYASMAPSSISSTAALSSAMVHRDKLIGFQNTSAQRTKIIDQAADFETPDGGTNMWASPQERALQLRAQQKKMREMEWNQKEEWEKREVVVSIDLQGRRTKRVMQNIEQPKHEDDDKIEEDKVVATNWDGGTSGAKSGAYSRNPLLKGLIKPTWKPSTNFNDGKQDGDEIKVEGLGRRWRRVQDDKADNEELILDGGDFGNEERERAGEPETEDSISFG